MDARIVTAVRKSPIGRRRFLVLSIGSSSAVHGPEPRAPATHGWRNRRRSSTPTTTSSCPSCAGGTLVDVLSLVRDHDPAVLALLPADTWAAGRPGRRRRRRRSRSGPQNRRRRGRRWHRIPEEVEPADLRVLIRVADELLGPAADGYALRRKARLVAVGAAGPALAGETVADRHADRIAGDHRLKLSTAAACAPFWQARKGISGGVRTGTRRDASARPAALLPGS